MLLAPFLRALCFALVSGGLLQVATEWLCWRLVPADVKSAIASPRATERRLLATALGARLAPWSIALALLTPAYLRGEDNPLAEHVSLLCLLAAATIAAWIAATCAQALLRLWRTRRFCRDSVDTGSIASGYAVLIHHKSRSLMAVAGILRPHLLVSQCLLLDGRVSRAALNVALDHEASHARHRDNLKLLLLAMLPGIPFASPSHASLETRWRLAAELAADAESTAGDPHRSVLLATLLLDLARDCSSAPPAALSTLLSAPQHLAFRVERLLDPACAASAQGLKSHRAVLTPIALTAIGLTGIAILSLVLGHRAAEMLLHLGS